MFGINEYDDTEKKDKELDEEMSETRRHEHRDYCLNKRENWEEGLYYYRETMRVFFCALDV